jgi:hypothetical protein
MGKSIRSKIKRSNRTQLRKTFSNPIVKDRNEKIFKQIAEDTTAKAGPSIIALGKLLNNNKKSDAMDNDEAAEEEEEERKAAMPTAFANQLPQFANTPFGHLNKAQKAQTPAVKITERLREKAIAKGTVTAKPKSTKKLEWFK